MLEYQFYY